VEFLTGELELLLEPGLMALHSVKRRRWQNQLPTSSKITAIK